MKVQDSQNWFHTGDLDCMDDDGYLFIIDRLKDMLKYQIIMYYPSEIKSRRNSGCSGGLCLRPLGPSDWR